jgi:predicted ester cyclase
MSRLVHLVSFFAIVGLFATAQLLRTSAQEGSPAAGTSSTMSLEETQAAIDVYLAALVARADIAPSFSDAIVLELVDVNQEIEGREAVAGAIVELHERTFDARPELTNLIVGEGTAAMEAVFIGTHTGEFAGIPASGKAVAVPYAVFYELVEGETTGVAVDA